MDCMATRDLLLMRLMCQLGMIKGGFSDGPRSAWTLECVKLEFVFLSTGPSLEQVGRNHARSTDGFAVSSGVSIASTRNKEQESAFGASTSPALWIIL